MTSFKQKWHALRKEKKSNIVAGLDPAVFEMGRREKGLPNGVDILKWSLDFIDSVAPFVVAIKPNAGYFMFDGGITILQEVVKHAHKLRLLVIMDSKIADIGSTSDAWIYSWKELEFDALTIAPYAGNVEQVIEYSHSRNIAVISMGIMSNPEFKTEMNFVNNNGVTLWKDRIVRGLSVKVDGLVVGGTYTKESKEFIEFIGLTKDSDVLYLIPGIGAQGGKVGDFLASGIDPKRCMINSGRGVMFPGGSGSTPKEQAEAAKKLRDDFNNAKI